MTRYDCVLFDADGTLLDYEAGEARALARALAVIGIEPCPAHLAAYREINARVWERFERREITQREIGRERFGELLARFGIRGDPEAVGERYLEFLGEEAKLIDGAREALHALRGRVTLALVTNGLGAVQRARLARSGIDTLLDAVVISGDLPIAKPDPRIFALALERAGGVPPHRAIMVGDNLASDVLGAIQAGLASCWFNPRGEANPFPFFPTYEIRSLAELPGIVGAQGPLPRRISPAPSPRSPVPQPACGGRRRAAESAPTPADPSPDGSPRSSPPYGDGGASSWPSPCAGT